MDTNYVIVKQVNIYIIVYQFNCMAVFNPRVVMARKENSIYIFVWWVILNRSFFFVDRWAVAAASRDANIVWFTVLTFQTLRTILFSTPFTSEQRFSAEFSIHLNNIAIQR